MDRLRIEGRWFMDESGRRVMLRGVNLGGSSKVPRTPNGATHFPLDCQNHREVSFIGRPFDLNEADEHFSRLRHWGFNCLRLLTTWEAIEHAGPGMYDEDYLDYFRQVVQKAAAHNLYVFIDPHQDVWSRFSGGDGAPGWTLELAGFNLESLDAAEAAVTMQRRFPDYYRMIWSSNRYRLASATMYTLFFGGGRFAPRFTVEGEPADAFLQRHFISAMVKVAERLVDLTNVIGYDSLNEPNSGYIGSRSLADRPIIPTRSPNLSGFDSMALGGGCSVEVPIADRRLNKMKVVAKKTLNPQGIIAWRSPEADIWRDHGVYDIDGQGHPVLLRDDYFSGADFLRDYLNPFIERYAAAIRKIDSRTILFIEGEPGTLEPMHRPADIPIVNASHWYDVITLFTKRYMGWVSVDWMTRKIVLLASNVQKMFTLQIAYWVNMSQHRLGGVPTLIGEFGLPFDLEQGKAYRDGDFSAHVRALSAYYNAMDANLVHSTIWNYTADNTNAHGDQWNEEDLSIFSRDQQKDVNDPDSGGRAVSGFCRPYVLAAAGTPVHMAFDQGKGSFELALDIDPAVDQPTVVYLPRIQYPRGVEVSVTSGSVEVDLAAQRVYWRNPAVGKQKMRFRRK